MLIYDLKKHFPPRAVEWLISGLLLSWGISVLMQPGMFESNPAFHYMTMIGGQIHWGLCALIVGSARGVALFVNGAWRRTPIIRIFAAFISAFIWTQILIGLLHSPIPTTALAFFPWFIAADFYSVFRAGADVVVASRNRALTGE